MKTNIVNNPTTKVILSSDDYEKLVEMANASDEKIRRKAIEYWQKHGIATININVYLRKTYVGQDFIGQEYSLDVMPSNVQIYDDPDKEKAGLAISKEQRDKIKKFAYKTANSIFLNSFGDKLSRINEIMHLKAEIKREWRMTRAFTLTGWLTAIALFIILMISK